MGSAIAVAAGIILVAGTALLRRAGFKYAYFILFIVVVAGAGVVYSQDWGIESEWFTFVCTVLTASLVVALTDSIRRRRQEKENPS